MREAMVAPARRTSANEADGEQGIGEALVIADACFVQDVFVAHREPASSNERHQDGKLSAAREVA